MRRDRKQVSKERRNAGRERRHAENLVGQLVNSINALLDMAAEDTSTAFYVRNKLQDIAMSVVNDLIDGRKQNDSK